MRFRPRNRLHWHLWFAWYPVWTDDGLIIWLEKVRRRWDTERNFRIYDAYDPGMYEGGWQYQETCYE
jgi:hypothetical protein